MIRRRLPSIEPLLRAARRYDADPTPRRLRALQRAADAYDRAYLEATIPELVTSPKPARAAAVLPPRPAATIPEPPYRMTPPPCVECGGPADTGAGHDCEAPR
jgi:hypothetical protein